MALLVNGQNIYDDIKKINETYGNSNKLYSTVDYLIFISETDTDYMLKSGWKYIRYNEKFFKYSDENVIMQNDSIKIYIDKKAKTIIVSKAKTIPLIDFNLDQIQASLSLEKTYTYIDFKDNNVGYKFIFNGNEREYESLTLKFNKTTFLISEICIIAVKNKENWSINNPQKLVIKYNYSANEDINLQIFDEKNYINIKEDNISVNEIYREYKIINRIR